MTTDKTRPEVVVAVISSIAIVIALGDQPYGYYRLLRLVLCGVSLFLAFGTDRHRAHWELWTLVGLAVLYNPLIPIYLRDKSVWTLANVITVAVFWIVALRPR